MSEVTFKVGDKVRYKNGGDFLNGEKVATVKTVKFEEIYFEETGTWNYADKLELVPPSRFEEALKELEKELILYKEKVKEFGDKVDRLEVTIQTLKEIDEKK